MKQSITLLAMCFGLIASTAHAAPPPSQDLADPSSAPGSAALCAKKADTNGLKGDARKKFTKECEASSTNQASKPLGPQQERMKKCNAQAKTQALKGDERKAFMKECLRTP